MSTPTISIPHTGRVTTGRGKSRQREAGRYRQVRRSNTLLEARSMMLSGFILDWEAAEFFQDLAELGHENAGELFAIFWPWVEVSS